MTENTIRKIKNTHKPAVFRQKMLDWYVKHRRVLPWRALPNEVADPYRVWLSEIMLQQTTVQAVVPYFLKFTEKWPNVHALAKADNDEVMSNWAGLGYYARARNLHKCAKFVSEELNGAFPSEQAELLKLAGIGDYTSAAIRSIAFDKPACVVDGNVERVMARYHAVKTPVPAGKKELKVLANIYSDGFKNSPSDYAQSLMDLGATICTPKSPACSLCPLNEKCTAYAEGQGDRYPIRSQKKARPHKHGYVYWIENEAEEVLIEKRPDKGLLGGMYGLPTSDWLENQTDIKHLAPFDTMLLTSTNHHIEHVFTHFSLQLSLFTSKTVAHNFKTKEQAIWLNKSEVKDIGLPTLFKKALAFYMT